MNVEELANFLADRVGADYDEVSAALTEYHEEHAKKPVVKKLKSTTEKAAVAKKKAADKDAKQPKTCQFKITRGAQKGNKCGTVIRGEGKFCSKHKNHKQEVENHKESNEVSICRNKGAQAWVVAGTDLVVKHPRNKTVVGRTVGKGVASKVVGLNAETRKQAKQLGLSIEESAPPPKKSAPPPDEVEDDEQSDDEDSDETW